MSLNLGLDSIEERFKEIKELAAWQELRRAYEVAHWLKDNQEEEHSPDWKWVSAENNRSGAWAEGLFLAPDDAEEVLVLSTTHPLFNSRKSGRGRGSGR